MHLKNLIFNKKGILAIVFMIIILTGCCKENHDEFIKPTIIGKWDIVQVDSCSRSNQPTSPFYVIQTFPDTGSIVFNNDSTGYFVSPIREITCNETNFKWIYNKLRGIIELDFPNGSTIAIIKTFTADSLELYIERYCSGISLIGISEYYCFKMKKN